MMGSLGMYRLSKGGRIDRGREVKFFFDGEEYRGYEGDSLASALLSHGVRLQGRSFKYHRPRGVLTAGSEEPNALVELRTGAYREPNTRATTVEIFEGLEAYSQNRWPSLSWDVMSLNGLLSPFFVAGFYYKTFMWPAKLWELLYEPIIRRAAGLGRMSKGADPDVYARKTVHCDVLVVGSGLSGLSAALSAGRVGSRVIVCEKDSLLGGRLLSDKLALEGEQEEDVVKGAEEELGGMKNVRIFKRTTVFGVYDGGTYGAVERVGGHKSVCEKGEPREVLWHIVAKRVIVASGGVERPLVCGDNDRPGVMLAGAARTYMARYGVLPGRRMVLVTNNDDGWKLLKTAQDAGVSLEAVVDMREGTLGGEEMQLAHAMGVKVVCGYVSRVHGGKEGVKGVDVKSEGGDEFVVCDSVLMSGGWDPLVGLCCHHGGRPVWDEEVNGFLPPKVLPKGMSVVGVANGVFSSDECVKEGHEAGLEASRACGYEGKGGSMIRAGREATYQGKPRAHGGEGGKAFVDFQHDVTLKDIGLAEQEGYISVEHLKRYTTLGMATDQGKLSNVNGLLEMSRLTGKSVEETGTTIFRPPFEPVSIGVLSGSHRGKRFRPYRLPPSHGWAKDMRAEFLEAGMWLRAQWYVKGDEKHWRESVDREVLAVRRGVGICDVSTLGKIEVWGSDAAVFLNRLYANPFLKLGVGKARYGVMLREDGLVMDDGTTSRLGEDFFVMTTTTVNAGPVMQHLEYCRQVMWKDLDVHVVSVSDTWGQFAVAGPRSRELLERMLEEGEDISGEGFPFMGAREVKVKGGVRGRLFRISFSGELAYEIALPSYYGDSFVRHAMECGEDLGVVPYGTEALGVMRIEKGHVAGPELNGTTTVGDLGLGKMASKKKDYVGRVMGSREGLVDEGRWRVVGVKPVERGERFYAGGHIFACDVDFTSENDLGYVTSLCFSPVEESYIGLALVKRGEERIGDRAVVYDPLHGESRVEIEICSPVFYDPEGGRQRG